MYRQDDEKFLDEDVRRNPGLITVASSYAKKYSGNFDFMRQARRQANGEGVLPVQMARAVLNCMLAAGEEIVFEEEEFEERPHLHIVKNLEPMRDERPRYMEHTLKVKYLFSTHKQAYRAHIIKYSLWTYFPARNEFNLHISSFCQSHLTRNYVAASAEIPEDYSVCNTCLSLQQAQKEELAERMKVTG